MSKITVKEYATYNKLSVQSVYKRIKSGKLEVQKVGNTMYIVVEDSIDYEKRFNELQLEHKALKDRYEAQKELILILKEDRQLFTRLIEHKKTIEQPTTKEKSKKKKKKKKDK